MKCDWKWLRIFVCQLAGLMLLGACSAPTDAALRPVVLVTVLGLSSDIVGLRVGANLNTAPALTEQEYRDGFGPSVVEYRFAVQLPPRAKGRLELSLTTLTEQGCYISENLKETADVAPGQFAEITVNLKRFAQPMCPLIVEKKGGQGSVKWRPEEPGCTGRCVAKFPIGSIVTLTTDGELGSQLLQWSGDCTGKDDCKLTMDIARQVTAQFAPTVTVRPVGPAKSLTIGRIISQPAGLDCGKTCTAGFPPDSKVKLSVPSTPPACFLGWGGACAGSDVCEVAVKDGVTVDAFFADCDSQSSGTSVTLNSVWASTAEDVWAIGGTLALRFNGSMWSTEKSIPDAGPYNSYSRVGVWTSGPTADVWMATSSSYSYRGSRAGSWTNDSSAYALTSVWGSAPNDIWFSDSNGYVYRSTGGFPLSSVQVTSPGGRLNRISGTSPNDVWVVGDGGYIGHWAGGPTWKRTPVMNVTIALYDVSAASMNEAWAVGAGGTIVRWDGTQWTREDHKKTTVTLRGVWAAGANDVWVVGDSATLLHWDGRAWAAIQTPGGSSINYRSIHGPDRKSFWIVGDGGTIIKYSR